MGLREGECSSSYGSWVAFPLDANAPLKSPDGGVALLELGYDLQSANEATGGPKYKCPNPTQSRAWSNLDCIRSDLASILCVELPRREGVLADSCS